MKNLSKSSAILLVALFCVTLAPAQSQSKDSNSWHFEATPYLWAAALEGDLRVRDTTAHVDSSFSDLFKQLDFTVATQFEARKGRWRLMLDENYVNLGTTGTGPLRNPVEIEPTLNFFEFAASYEVVTVANKNSTDSEPLPPVFSAEIIGGGRHTHFGLGLEPANRAPIEGSRNLVDVFVGNRFKARVHPAVTFVGKYTVGGGGSDFAGTVTGLVDFNIRKSMSASIGYQLLHMNADKPSNVVGFNGEMRGLILGLTLHK